MSDTASHSLPVVGHKAPDPHTHRSLHPHVERGGVAEGPLEHVHSTGREVGGGNGWEGPTITTLHTIDLLRREAISVALKIEVLVDIPC